MNNRKTVMRKLILSMGVIALGSLGYFTIRKEDSNSSYAIRTVSCEFNGEKLKSERALGPPDGWYVNMNCSEKREPVGFGVEFENPASTIMFWLGLDRNVEYKYFGTKEIITPATLEVFAERGSGSELIETINHVGSALMHTIYLGEPSKRIFFNNLGPGEINLDSVRNISGR
jgi:hypothetical protein